MTDSAEVARPQASPSEVRLSVIIPAYHEAEAIGGCIERVRAELAGVAEHGGLEIIVVDDGSRDGTAAAAAAADRVIALPLNRGKGAAVRAGMLAAHGRTVAFTDADLSYAPVQIAGLLEAVEDGWDAVVGNRQDERSTELVPAGLLRRLGGRGINVATRLVLRGRHADTQCGLKAFRSEVAAVVFGHTRVDGFAFDVEVIHLLERYGASLLEVPVEVTNTEASTVHVVRDALRLLVDLVRVRHQGVMGHYDLGPEERRLLSAEVAPVGE